MKKNKLLYIFILIVTVLSFNSVKAAKIKNGMEELTTGMFGKNKITEACDTSFLKALGQGVIQAPTNPIWIISSITHSEDITCPAPVMNNEGGESVNFTSEDGNYFVYIYTTQILMKGNLLNQIGTTVGITGDEAQGYGLIGKINKYNGETLSNNYQFISNQSDLYTLKEEVPFIGCYALVDHGGVGHDDEIWLASYKEDLNKIKRNTDGIDGNAKILERSAETPYKTCTLVSELNKNKESYDELKKERRKYKQNSSEYKAVQEKLKNNLIARKTIVNEIKQDPYFSYNGKFDQELKIIEREETILKTATENRGEKVSGCDVFGPNITPIIKWAINLIRIGGAVLVVVFGVMDFANILLSGEEKNFKEAGMKFGKRLIALLLLIFIPYLLTFLLDLSGVLKQYGIEDVYCVVNF